MRISSAQNSNTATSKQGLNRRWLIACAVLAALAVLAFAMGKLHYFLLGITGAIFANSTGAGGGVVFIPLFNQLGLSDAQAVATSFGIQCFGMTAGTLTWLWHYRRLDTHSQAQWQIFGRTVLLGAGFSILGIWTTYALELPMPASLSGMFRLFSAVLGVAILYTVWRRQNAPMRIHLHTADTVSLIMIGYLGGIITAWLSVGVGEIIAFYLIFRRFNITMAVAAAVAITAITVWSVAPLHMAADSPISWDVVSFAAPGAICGGIIARFLVNRLSGRGLKIFFACWLLIIAAFG